MTQPTPPDAEHLLLAWYANEWLDMPQHRLRAHLFWGRREALVLTWPMPIDDVGRGSLHAAAAYCLCRSTADIGFVVEIGPVPEPDEYPRAQAWVAISHLRRDRIGVTNFHQLCPGTERDSLVSFLARAIDHDQTAEQMCLDLPDMLRLWAEDHLALLPPSMRAARATAPPDADA